MAPINITSIHVVNGTDTSGASTRTVTVIRHAPIGHPDGGGMRIHIYNGLRHVQRMAGALARRRSDVGYGVYIDFRAPERWQ